jgi:hypothetical protein
MNPLDQSSIEAVESMLGVLEPRLWDLSWLVSWLKTEKERLRLNEVERERARGELRPSAPSTDSLARKRPHASPNNTCSDGDRMCGPGVS